MARYEFAEGSSSKFWEIRLNGTQFTVRYGRIGTAGQEQTKAFNSSELAKKEHDKLVAEKVKKGYKAVDGTGETAKTPASATPPAAPAEGKLAPAALRKDVYVYNEATGFSITSKRMGGKGIGSGTKEWHKAVSNGDLIPIELVQDDPFTVRVVVGGCLEREEAEEWVGRLDWKLRVPDGNLVICGGSEYVMEEFEDEEDSYMAQYLRHIAIPRGEYRATVYMYMNSINGKECMRIAREGDEPPPYGEWFRTTRPGEEFPIWLKNECIDDPSEDPGHEKEWEKAKAQDDPHTEYVQFLLHLTPLKPGEKVEMPKVREGTGDDGWFSTPTACRIPERMPLGLPTRDLEGREEETDHGPQAVDIFQYTVDNKRKRAPVKGSVQVPMERLDRLYRVAWFCHFWSFPQIYIAPPPGQAMPNIEAELENTFFISSEQRVVISFACNGRQSDGLRAVRAAGEHLKGRLPDGCTLELDSVYNAPEHLSEAMPIGFHRYKGIVKADVLTVTEAFPVADAEKLNAALELSAQTEKGPLIETGSDSIAQCVLASLKEHPYFSENPAVRKGTAIGQKKFEEAMLNLIAAEVFRRSFSEWPCFIFDDTDEEDEDDEADEGDSKGPPRPPRGDLLLQGANRRRYYVSGSDFLDKNSKQQMAEIEAEMKALGFNPLGDLVCNEAEYRIVRAYARPGGHLWGVHMLAHFSRGMFEFQERFADGARLSTGQTAMLRDEIYRGVFRSARQQSNLAEMLQDHTRRAAYLAEFHGPSKAIDATLKGLAQELELDFVAQEVPVLPLLLKGAEYSHFTAEAKKLHPGAPKAVAEADALMAKLGFAPVGDVVNTFLKATAFRGYTRPGGVTWALFQLDTCSAPEPAGRWEFVTHFEKGAVLQSARVAMSKDDQKRKIFRILDHACSTEELLAKHEKRTADLSGKWGAPKPTQSDMKGLAEQSEHGIWRMMG